MVRVDFVQSLYALCFSIYQPGDSPLRCGQCFLTGFLSGPDSWKEPSGCWLAHLVAAEVDVPEKYEGLVSRAGLKHTPSF